MKTFPSSTKEITHPVMQCHTAEDRNPEQNLCYTPGMSATQMKTIPAPLNKMSKKYTACIILTYRNGGERHTLIAVMKNGE
jgi:hypothetical protein